MPKHAAKTTLCLCLLALALSAASALAGSRLEARAGYRLPVLKTAYCLRGRTRSGGYVHPGSIAVDPRLIPLGSRLFVPGYGWGRAEDTGSAVLGHHIDVWMASCADALRATAQVTVTVYR